MPLIGLAIELRPNLSSGIVFLQFDRELCLRAKTRLVIKEHAVHIVEPNGNPNGELIIRLDCFGMDLGHVSAFLINDNHISFRFNYTQIDLAALAKSSVQAPLRPLQLQFAEQTPISLHCAGCQMELVPPTSYNRLREFPSCLIDPSEFFCHQHSHPHTAAESQSSLPSLPSLLPGATDLFYGLNHIVLNVATLQTRVQLFGDLLHCARCLRLLGHTMLKGALAAKLWADALHWRPANEKPSLPLPLKRPLFQHSSLTQLTRRMLAGLWPLPPPQLSLGASKALLLTTQPNCRQLYMLLHVLESELCVLRRADSDSEGQLCSYRACKLYYRVFSLTEEQGAKEQAKEPLLQEWLRREDVPQLSISSDMFLALHERLERNTQLIPFALRHNLDEEQLLLSYFFYEQEKEEKAQEQTQLTTKLDKLSLSLGADEEYETDAGHASQEEGDSDDEHSDEQPKRPMATAAIVVAAQGAAVKQHWPQEQQALDAD